MPIQINELVIKAEIAPKDENQTQISEKRIREVIEKAYASITSKPSSNRKNDR